MNPQPLTTTPAATQPADASAGQPPEPKRPAASRNPETLGLSLALGVSMGLSLGVALGNLGVWLLFGLCMGLALSFALNAEGAPAPK